MEKTMHELKVIVRINDIPMWKIADAIGIAESTLYIWMRKYNADHYKKILDAMKEIDPKGVEKALSFLKGCGD